MKSRPQVVAFDIIETVFSLEGLRDRLVSVGLPQWTLEAWFAQVLRDAFALETTGVYQPFREIAAALLESQLVEHGCPADSAGISRVLDGFAELEPHPDAVSAFERLHEAKVRIVALTNGSAEVTGKMLARAGLAKFVERMISIEEIRHWKPSREVYLHAANRVGVGPQRLALVAAHPWDIHGAGRAGLTTAFVARGKPYPATMMPPDISAETLADVADAVVALRA
jgi:2-haloacid dehalogenase